MVEILKVGTSAGGARPKAVIAYNEKTGEVTLPFNEAYFDYLDDNTRYLHFYGSAGSGKSVFVAQKLILESFKYKEGQDVLVVRKIEKTIKESVFKLLKSTIYKWKLDPYFDMLKSPAEITNNLVVGGNLTVNGTSTIVNSTTVEIGDNIISLNGSGAANAGLVVRDATAASLVSGSLLWNTTTDKWIAGPLGSELEIATISGTQTLTNKTIDGSQLVAASVANAKLTNSSTTIGTTAIALGASSTTLAGLTSVTSTAFVGALTGNASTVTTNANLTGDVTSVGNATTIGAAKVTNAMLAGSISNANLANSTISGISLGSNLATLTISTGLSGTSYNGSGAITIANTGVTSNVASTGISVSGATGAVTITNTGVTSAVASTGVNVSGATGAVTFSIGQAVATTDNLRFNSLGIGMAASATAGRIDATNDVVAFSSSDIRFKENIVPIENALDKISKISGNTYDWKAENKIEHGYEGNDVGVIAQEIEAVLPQLVQTRENGFKAVKYDKLVALLIEGIKEQQTQIEKLRMDLDNYECKCDNCKSK